MRQPQNAKRGRGRGRRGNGNAQPNVPNRNTSYESNGPDVSCAATPSSSTKNIWRWPMMQPPRASALPPKPTHSLPTIIFDCIRPQSTLPRNGRRNTLHKLQNASHVLNRSRSPKMRHSPKHPPAMPPPKSSTCHQPNFQKWFRKSRTPRPQGNRHWSLNGPLNWAAMAWC